MGNGQEADMWQGDGTPARLWERRPHWRRGRRPGVVNWDETNAGLRRWLRDPEPFERAGEHEPYPGATVLFDLRPEMDEQATLRVLARYTVTRLFILWSDGVLAGPKLLTERRVALEHLALLPTHDWERRALERLAGLCRSLPSPEAVTGALLPAECAAKRGHVTGAFALYRAAYEVAVRKRWWEEAAACAGGIARVAGMYEAPRSRRVWNWRVRVLRRRLEQVALAAQEMSGSPGIHDGGQETRAHEGAPENGGS